MNCIAGVNRLSHSYLHTEYDVVTYLITVPAGAEDRGRDGDNVVTVLVDFAARAQADLEERTLHGHL